MHLDDIVEVGRLIDDRDLAHPSRAGIDPAFLLRAAGPFLDPRNGEYEFRHSRLPDLDFLNPDLNYGRRFRHHLLGDDRIKVHPRGGLESGAATLGLQILPLEGQKGQNQAGRKNKLFHE